MELIFDIEMVKGEPFVDSYVFRASLHGWLDYVHSDIGAIHQILE